MTANFSPHFPREEVKNECRDYIERHENFAIRILIARKIITYDFNFMFNLPNFRNQLVNLFLKNGRN